MIQVKEILPSDDSCHLGLMIGGDTAMLRAWPVNPDGEPLLLIATIHCEPFRQLSGCDLIPKEGTLYLFSTYSETDYFLENVSYSGSESEFSAIINGYTCVVRQDATTPIESPARSIPMRFLKLQDRSVTQEEYPVFSMVSSIVPKGIYLHPELQENYQFVLQFYSSDFPEPYEGIFYLTDSVGCLLLKKDGSGDGFFFVHSG